MFESELHQRITELLQRLKRDYPHMTSVDVAQLVLEEIER